jgi:hypothetical protein
MADNFFALLEDQTIRRIVVLPAIETSINNLFLLCGAALTQGKQPVEFDANYQIEDDELWYIEMALPDAFQDVVDNPIGLSPLDLKKDEIKAIFWYEDGKYYFQNFDSRKLLDHKFVLFFDKQTFNQLTENAFVIDDAVNAVYDDGKLYFTSYANANKIFSLIEYYRAVTDEELNEFAQLPNISVADIQWLSDNANTVIRKYVGLLVKSDILDNLDTNKVKSGAKKFNLNVTVDGEGKIVLPQDIKACRDILYFLNEQFYEGLLTDRHYKTNSKKQINN